jgi:hypothetical protein
MTTHMSWGQERLEAATRDHTESTPAKGILQHFQHFIHLYELMGTHLVRNKPTYLINGQHYAYDRSLLHKQEVMYRTGQVSTRALMFGSYCGHALLILLASNPTLNIVCVDNAPYAPSIVNYLNQHFQNRIMLFVGNYKDGLALFADNVFDLVHLDTDATVPLVFHNFQDIQRVAIQGAFIMVDGYDQIRSLIDTWIEHKILNKTMVSPPLWTSIVTNLCKK